MIHRAKMTKRWPGRLGTVGPRWFSTWKYNTGACNWYRKPPSMTDGQGVVLNWSRMHAIVFHFLSLLWMVLFGALSRGSFLSMPSFSTLYTRVVTTKHHQKGVFQSLPCQNINWCYRPKCKEEILSTSNQNNLIDDDSAYWETIKGLGLSSAIDLNQQCQQVNGVYRHLHYLNSMQVLFKSGNMLLLASLCCIGLSTNTQFYLDSSYTA